MSAFSAIFAFFTAHAGDALVPNITIFSLSNGVPRITFQPAPAIEQYRILSGSNVTSLTKGFSGELSGFTWAGSNAIGLMDFFKVHATPLSSNALLAANVLNRLAYGPTPDDLPIVTADPQSYIDSQLAPETITETVDDLVVQTTEGIGITDSAAGRLNQRLQAGDAELADLRAWFCHHAVGAKRQLLEVLLQFLENHFVTQHQKSMDYFMQFYPDGASQDRAATDLEYREIQRWREALLNPNCTFSDLLTISAESPAMIIYLDSVGSRGASGRIPNENYARELLELFTFGVDNGYDQDDITTMSRAWTGWSVRLVDEAKIYDPFALQSTTTVPGALNGSFSNLVGRWAFNFRTNYHYTGTDKRLFTGKTVPPRFGLPWVGRDYQLDLPATSGTNGIRDGYEILAHLCNQPFTEEFISVKLCRLFVHDEFEHRLYDYTLPNLSPEAQLVRDCMLIWENSTPKGRIRDVLATIFNSALFRSHGGSMQKVKTPLEFAASTLRAFRAAKPGGGFTACTDGYSFATPLERMGMMQLFNRAAPDGYPEGAAGWISAGTLAERVRFVQSCLIGPGQNGKEDAGAANCTDPVGLITLKLPSTSWTNAAALADLFVSLIYPGEGKANLNQYRTAAINFLNTNEAGVSSPLNTLSTVAATGPAGTGDLTPYDVRVRGMVAMLLTFPRFQEQ